jgi:hypothetical protein
LVTCPSDHAHPPHPAAHAPPLPPTRLQERRKRRGGPLRLAGLCLPPKALAPLVPLYLQVRVKRRPPPPLTARPRPACSRPARAAPRLLPAPLSTPPRHATPRPAHANAAVAATPASPPTHPPTHPSQGALAGGTPEVREAAVEALGELVELTSEEALKPFVVQITGPLIRIVGDRFPSAIKAAILVTLGRLIVKAGPGLKPFVPQLQTTFIKCLADAAPGVRSAAAANLGELTRLSARVDQLTSDLAASAVSSPEPDTRVAYLQALRGALAASGARLTPPTLAKVEESLEAAFRAAGALPAGPGSGEAARAAVAAALGAYAGAGGPDAARRMLALATGPLAAGSPGEREAGAMALAALARGGAGALSEAGLLSDACAAAVRYAREPDHECRVAAGRAAARLAAHDPAPGGGAAAVGPVLQALLGPDQGSEVARQALVALRRLVQARGADAIAPHLQALLPCVTSLLQRDPNSQLRAAAEAALKHALGLASGDSGAGGLDAATAAAVAVGGTARAYLTDAYLRRLAKLAEDEWEDPEDY